MPNQSSPLDSNDLEQRIFILEDQLNTKSKKLVEALACNENHLREAQDFAQSTVDALSAHIAILDEQGVILAVNHAWRQFAEQNDADAVGTGVNYIATLQAVDGNSEDGPTAQAVLSGIQQIIQGEISEFSLEYPCHSPAEKRWFTVRITRFAHENSKRIVVAHENITERVLSEQIIAADKTRLEHLVSERAVTALEYPHQYHTQ